MDALSSYVALWAEKDPVARVRLVRACWTEESEIVGPGYRFKGCQEVLDEAARFHRDERGHRAIQTSGFDRHGNWVRFTIAMVDTRGSVLIEGWDVAELREDGKIQRVVTFWGPLPPSGRA